MYEEALRVLRPSLLLRLKLDGKDRPFTRFCTSARGQSAPRHWAELYSFAEVRFFYLLCKPIVGSCVREDRSRSRPSV